MILLTLLAVGLLTLSGVSLRAGAQSEAMATARANARLAMMLALGDLQKSAGPDQRITARADVLDEKSANPRLTGVWQSWEIKASPEPQPDDYKKSTRDAKFLGWLTSGSDRQAVRQTSFASRAPSEPVTLMGKGTLGSQAAASDFVTVSSIPVVTKSRGTVAWAVLDEGIKVRVNTPYADDATSPGAKTAQLGAGERPGTEFIKGLSPLERSFFEQDSEKFATVKKGVSQLNFALAAENLAPGLREILRPLTHDVTTHSVGLLTDTARGGFKEDFQLLTNSSSLPSGYANKGVYVSNLGMNSSTVPSDPQWGSLQEFARLYKTQVSNSNGVPLLKATTPARWQAATKTGNTTVLNLRPPTGVVLLPTIAKVQMLFSLIGRDLYSYPAPAGNRIPADAPIIHGPQGGNFKGTKYQYDLHLLYTPIVTLHNPYNVAIELRNVRLEFVHVPFAMQVFRSGKPLSTGLVPLETMYADNQQGQQGKIFGMNLKTKTRERPGGTTFSLLPGEVKMFSPYIDPNRTYQDDLGSRQFWDIYVGSGITSNIDAIPGWRGDGIGYDCDWIAGDKAMPENFAEGRWASCVGIARDDDLYVEFAPLGIPASKNKFTIQMSAATGTTSTPVIVNAIEMDYEKPTGLQDFILGRGKTLRYPKTGSIKGLETVDHATVPIKNIRKVKPFALLSVQAKSTSGGRDPSNEDGRLATKPWCFAHASSGASGQKVITEHSANFSHEVDLQLLEKGTANLLPIDLQDRTVFISGHTNLNGTKFGALYDIPLAPLQNLATLNGANPGGSSGYLPRFAQPIGTSWAHPLISADKMMEPQRSGNYLDHSFMLNLALYDRYYFSGLADQTGPFGTGKTSKTLATDYAAGQPLDDPRLTLNPPAGKSAADFPDLLEKDTAAAEVAAWQRMAGAFNINSTSVAAWKAMLASIHDSQAIFNQLDKANSSSKLTPLDPPRAGSSRISRLRLPAAPGESTAGDPKDTYWLGPREYTDTQLQTLAENIVKQVRLRGPFLSMAEFVNRQLGSGELAQSGALQQAIDESGINLAPALAANAGFEIPAATVADYKYANLEAGAGPSYQGAPGFLSQADLLNVLGNAATARSDTFTIRGYGEARDTAGKVTATAVCEAVVQRVAEYVDPADPVGTVPAALLSEANKFFGRRFLILSYRWLNQDEI
ncbi:MAG: hypothetical protein K9N23_18210 [Akkermansiaceae bacterium]|nr:hypothetical protein [Akkermansiaceae bacterium]